MERPPASPPPAPPAPAWILPSSAALLIIGAAAMAPNGQLTDPDVLQRFFLAAAVMLAGFALTWRLKTVGAAWFWGVALAARLLLLPMEPGDDIWRYLWEGHIQTLGFNPFELAPDATALVPWRTPWWGLINHQDVSAIYPPLTQLLFRLLALGGPSVLAVKLAIVAADLGVCALLARHFGHGPSLLYAWNPLILTVFAGSGHFDSWFLLPLVAAWFLIDPAQGDRRWLAGALLLGVSIAIKWISLPVLGFLAWRSLRARRPGLALLVGALGLMPMVASALVFCEPTSCPLVPTGSSFVRYGRSAELLPHLVGAVWSASRSWNALFLLAPLPVLALLTLRARSVAQFCRWWFLCLFFTSPIIHAWYFSWLIPFAVPNRHWGARLVSGSAFLYFVLPSRLPVWELSDPERLLLWGPLLFGTALSALAGTADPVELPENA